VADAAPLVGVIMGSDSDLGVMQDAVDVLAEFRIPYEVRIVSAHRTPDVLVEYARTASDRGVRVIIAGAGGAAHLPGMTASMTTLPVIGVPVPLGQLDGLDSLLSIVQMPAGVPVATMAIGNARNAALLAVRILAISDAELRVELERFADTLAEAVREKDARVRDEHSS
jgi:5-(carboxyamino)imidazole ribonucleotide mutase